MSELNFYARYKKIGRAKYISHLDIVRVFNRVFRRGGIPAAYSEGFNPHPKISFALPLPVFYESECEIMLFSLASEMSAEELLKRFNSVSPEGIEVTEVLPGKPPVGRLSAALYEVSSRVPTDEELQAFLSLPEIVIPKKTKSGINETDIKKDIKEIKIENGRLKMLLSAGSSANLKPDTVVSAMEKYIPHFAASPASYLRLAVFDDAGARI